MGRRPRPRAIDRMTRFLAASLEPADTEKVRASTAGWTDSDWSDFRAAVSIHGLAPHLARQGRPADAPDPFSADVRRWLNEQAVLNARRMERMHAELGRILTAAERAGIAVMPLKGALLTTIVEGPTHRRPMADLDLLVRPSDREGMHGLLAELGYRHRPEHAPRPTHDVFVDPGGGIVVHDGEHPDNPRRVEVHVEVKRHLWGWADDDDLTDALWAGARDGQVVGARALIPDMPSLLAHVAIHATSDLLGRRGRLVQWLDLATVAPRVARLDELPHPSLALPSLALSRRALPRQMAAVDLEPLGERVPPALVRWASTVPLGAACGLSVGRLPDRPASLGARLERWRPDRWRLLVAYGGAPLPVALVRHGAMVARRARERHRPRG